MRLLPKIIVISTLITGSHFLFRNQSSAVEWLVWNLSNLIGGASILSAFVFYYATPFYRIGIKLFTGAYLVLCVLDLFAWLYNGGHDAEWVSAVVLCLFGLYALLKASQWNLNNIKEYADHVNYLYNDKIYIVFKRPTSFMTWVGSLFGWGVGSLYIVHAHQKFYMSNKKQWFTVKYFSELYPDEIAFELQLSQEKKDWFLTYLRGMIDTPFNMLKSNCVSSLKEGFDYIGIKPKTILPSQYFKVFIRNRKNI